MIVPDDFKSVWLEFWLGSWEDPSWVQRASQGASRGVPLCPTKDGDHWVKRLNH